MKHLIHIVILFTLTGCNKNINGEVFVVTKSGQSIKLGLVEVIALSEKKLTSCIDEKTLDWATKHQSLFNELPSVQEAQKQAQEYLSLHKATVEMHIMALAVQDLEYTENDRKKDAESLSKAFLKEKEATNKLIALKKEYELLKKGSFIVDCIGTNTIAKSITNADGQFSMDVPNEKIAIFATSQRNILDETENYYWLVWLDKSEKHIMLSNNNTYETQCPTCVVKLVGLPDQIK